MMLKTIFRYPSKILPLSEESLLYFHLVKHSEFLLKHVPLFHIQFIPFWTAYGSSGTSTGLTHEKGFWLHSLFQQTPWCASHCSDLSTAGGWMGSTAMVQSCNWDCVKTAILTLHHRDQGPGQETPDPSQHMSSNTFVWKLACEASMKRSSPIFWHGDRDHQDQRQTPMQM